MIYRVIKRVLVIGIVLGIIFVIFSLANGGSKLRWLGDQVGGIFEEKMNKLADQADTIKDEANSWMDNMRSKYTRKYE